MIPPRSPLREKAPAVSRFSFYSDITLPLERSESTVDTTGESQHQEKGRQTALGSPKAWVCLAILGILSFSNGLSTTFLASALPTASRDSKVEATASFWLVISFLLSRTLAQPIFSHMAQAKGPNPIILLGCFLYGLGSIISGASSPTTDAAILLGRCIEGFGSGAITIATPMVLRESGHVLIDDKSAKAVAICYWLGAALGPILGAGMATTVGWQDFFFVTAAIGFAGFAALPFVVVPPDEDESKAASLSSVDCVGWLIISGSLLSVSIALVWAGTAHAWSSPQVLAPLILGLLGAAGWLAYLSRRKGALLPIPTLNNINSLKQCFDALILGIIYMAIIHFLPLYLLAVKGSNPLAAASTLLSWTMSTFFVSFAVAAFPQLVRSIWTAPLAWTALFISTGLLISLNVHTATAVCVPFGLLAGCAIGTLQIALLDAESEPSASQDEGRQHSPHARGMITFSQSLGNTIGIVLSACIFLNVLRSALGSHKAIDAVHLLETVRQPGHFFLKACTAALDGVWIFCCNLAALAFMLSIASAVSAYWRRKPHAISV